MSCVLRILGHVPAWEGTRAHTQRRKTRGINNCNNCKESSEGTCVQDGHQQCSPSWVHVQHLSSRGGIHFPSPGTWAAQTFGQQDSTEDQMCYLWAKTSGGFTAIMFTLLEVRPEVETQATALTGERSRGKREDTQMRMEPPQPIPHGGLMRLPCCTLPRPWSTALQATRTCGFEPLCFGVVCYTATDN